MKLVVKNFKCWISKEIDIDDIGIILISGKSGKGKSSIIDAIRFVLNGKIQKCIHFNKKNCQVEFFHNNLYIKRSKNPNRLIVKMNENVYEDDVAQEIIYKEYGLLFEDVSVIPQNPVNNFVYLSSSQKLSFIENFIFNKGLNIEEVGQNIKNNVKFLKEETIKSEQKIVSMSNIGDTFKPNIINIEEWEKLLKKYNILELNHNTLNTLLYNVNNEYKLNTNLINETTDTIEKYKQILYQLEIKLYKWKEWSIIKKDRYKMMVELENQCIYLKSYLDKIIYDDIINKIKTYETFDSHITTLKEKYKLLDINELSESVCKLDSWINKFQFKSLDESIQCLHKNKQRVDKLIIEQSIIKKRMMDIRTIIDRLNHNHLQWIDYTHLIELYNEKNKQLLEYRTEYDNYKKSENFDDIQQIIENKKIYENQLNTFLQMEMKKECITRLSEITHRIKEYKKILLWPLHSKITCEEKIKSIKEWLSNFSHNKMVRSEICKVKSELDTLTNHQDTLKHLYSIKNIYKCPSCDVELLLKKNTLFVSYEKYNSMKSIEDTINALEKEQLIYQTLENKYINLQNKLIDIDNTLYEEYKDNLSTLTTYYNENMEKEQEVKTNVSILEKEKCAIETKISTFTHINICELSMNDLISKIEYCNNRITKYSIYTNTMKEYKDKIDKCILPSKPPIINFDINKFNAELKENNELLCSNDNIYSANEITLHTLQKTIYELNIIIDYKDKLKRIKEIKDTIELLQSDHTFISLHSEYQQLKSTRDMYISNKNKYDIISKEMERVNKIIEEDLIVNETFIYIDEEHLKNEIKHYTQQIKALSTKANELHIHTSTLQKINIHIEQYIKYNHYLVSISDYKQEHSVLLLKYKNALDLEQIFNQTKYKCMYKTISLLNFSIQKFIDIFFSNESMVCKLSTVKQTKKGDDKAQLNIQIIYKNMECDFNTLSGGEKDRILLAFTLAFSELNHSSLVLLDECINSLDQETTEIIINGIKTLYSGKNIICISHQVIHGMFDQVINLD